MQPRVSRIFEELECFSCFLFDLNKKTKMVCDFFKGYVKLGIKDAHYYHLIYMMLTYQLKGGYQLGFQMSQGDEFNKEFLPNLPPEMQEERKGSSFYDDGSNSDP